jgi:hypothetical protein
MTYALIMPERKYFISYAKVISKYKLKLAEDAKSPVLMHLCVTNAGSEEMNGAE